MQGPKTRALFKPPRRPRSGGGVEGTPQCVERAAETERRVEQIRQKEEQQAQKQAQFTARPVSQGPILFGQRSVVHALYPRCCQDHCHL